ncbi:MBL fold metallo-hydrolase [uncultured Oscillibacter sp.]|uniref:MBL fold metallo-hydrolase n=1 Tax=uncultured Oscillibacter sp. TaxID=876091 RepID=UPI0026273D01|nr:MBL fold metallo-hydrolase [uncultured Oscillibacter sp.]
MLSLFLIPLMLFSACGAPSAPSPVETEASVQVQPTEQVRPVEGVPGPAELLYQGQASMRIVTDEGKVIYIDPYVGEGYDLPADLILVTHAHYDHNGVDRIENRNPDCQVITWKEAIQNGEHQVFDLGYVTVEAVEAAKLVGAKHNIPYHVTARNDVFFDRTLAEQFNVENRLILDIGETLLVE